MLRVHARVVPHARDGARPLMLVPQGEGADAVLASARARLRASGWQVRGVSDEHTVLERIGDGPDLALGDKPLLVPGHVDPTVNLHEWIVAVRNDRVEAVWPVDARGAVF